MFPGVWLVNLRYLQSAKVEGVKLETSFMSEQASLFLSSIGLLGEYCPLPREKEKNSGSGVGCMHLELRQGYTRHQGCQFMRPVLSLRNFYHIEEETCVGEDNLLPF
ncbi:hypothetical protein Salat_0528400 [Sesamum alatum]|uniref:Uncharacterized protein n=1 Tax=Sesamum alatum TaxID=300844 RepID=A0AAE1YPA3_9LAMI|nr:hypothetical protein Salat_0528400 [Sesamum alatum]